MPGPTTAPRRSLPPAVIVAPTQPTQQPPPVIFTRAVGKDPSIPALLATTSPSLTPGIPPMRLLPLGRRRQREIHSGRPHDPGRIERVSHDGRRVERPAAPPFREEVRLGQAAVVSGCSARVTG